MTMCLVYKYGGSCGHISSPTLPLKKKFWIWILFQNSLTSTRELKI